MKSITCEITGQSALLMHNFPMVPIEALEKKSPEEQAEYAAYRDPETHDLIVPAICVQRCFVSGATYSKGKGRSSLQKIVAACVEIGPTERLSLHTQTFTIDSRPVVVPATKGRVVRHRPRLDRWSLAFTIDYDETLLTEAQMRRVVDDSGSRVGLLDFRPEKKGPFGRFVVTNWK